MSSRLHVLVHSGPDPTHTQLVRVPKSGGKPGKALRALEEACDALVEEHEEALARYLAGGARADEALAGCDLGSVEPWRSPCDTRIA